MPPSHKSSQAAATGSYSGLSFAAQATSAVSLAATVTSTSTVQPKSTAGATTATSTSHFTFPQSGIIAIVVGTLGLAVIVLFVMWLCKRRKSKKAEGDWRRLNASQDGLGTTTVGGKTVRVMGGKPIGAEEGEAKWGQRGDGEKIPLPSPTGALPMLGYQMGSAEGPTGGGLGLDRAGTKAQYQFAAISRDPLKMAAAREELLARGPGGKNPNQLTVNTTLTRSLSSKSKISSPINISAPLPSPTPSESYIVRPPPSPFRDDNMAKDIYPPPPAATIVNTTVEPVDSWAEQTSQFPIPRSQIRPETIISLGSTQAADESYRNPSKEQLVTNIGNQSFANRRQSTAFPRRKLDTVFATIETYGGDPDVNGWRPESTFARPQTLYNRTSPPRPARSSSVGRRSSTRDVVDAFPVPPPMPTGLGLASSSPTVEGMTNHPLAVPEPAAAPGIETLASTAPLRLARAKSRSGKVPSPITVPSLSVVGIQPMIGSAPLMAAMSEGGIPLASPGLRQDRRRSMGGRVLARQFGQEASAPAPEVPRPARAASIRHSPTRSPSSPIPPAMPLSSPPAPAGSGAQTIMYGSPIEQSALAALTHRSPKLASTPSDSSSPAFNFGTPASTQDSAFGAPTTPASSAPSTPKDFDPRLDGETEEERREAETALAGGKGTGQGVSVRVVGSDARATLFPPLEGDKLNGRTYNNDRTLSIYNMYDD